MMRSPARSPGLVSERPSEPSLPPGPDESSWLPASSREALRLLVARELAGERHAAADVSRLAAAFAHSARDQAHPPERLLIAVRAVWQALGLAQSDRLQLASLYDRLMRETIERYFRE